MSNKSELKIAYAKFNQRINGRINLKGNFVPRQGWPRRRRARKTNPGGI